MLSLVINKIDHPDGFQSASTRATAEHHFSMEKNAMKIGPFRRMFPSAWEKCRWNADKNHLHICVHNEILSSKSVSHRNWTEDRWNPNHKIEFGMQSMKGRLALLPHEQMGSTHFHSNINTNSMKRFTRNFCVSHWIALSHSVLGAYGIKMQMRW